MTKIFSEVRTGICFALTVGAIFLTQSPHALGATKYWSGDGLSAGGVGTWNTTLARFGSASGGPYTTVWNNTTNAGDTAIFDGTAASVTVGTVTVNSLTFSPNPVAAYTLTGGTITFSGANPTITVNTGGTTNTTLTSNYTGTSQITKMGIGRLELNNASNTNAGGYNIVQGFINLAAANRLGTGAANPGTLDPDWFKFGGGGLTSSNAAAQDLGAMRGVTLAGAAWFGASAGNNPVTISAPITGSGSINISGSSTSGSPLNTSFNSGMNLTLTNTGNNWTGGVNVTLGTLTVGAAGVIPDGTAISLTGGSGVGSELAVGTFSETVGTVLVNGSLAEITGGTGGVLIGTSYDLRRSGTISAVLGGANVVATKTTANDVTLTGANTFTGGFNLNAGTVRIGSATALGAANSAVAIGNNTTLATSNTTARTPAYAYTINGNFTLGEVTPDPGTGVVTMAGTMNLGSAMRTITIANATDTISAVVSGTGGINKAGAGVLVLSGATSSYDGATTITTGKIQATSANALGSTVGDTQVPGGTELLFDGATSNFTTPEPIQIDGSGAGDGGAISVQNLAKITLSGPVTLTSSATLSTASLASATYSNANAITSTDLGLTLQGAAGVPNQFQTIANGTISGAITLGAGSLTKSESGTWTLSNAAGNSYNGGTTINEGTLLANNTTGSATGSGPVNVSGTGTLGGTGNTDATGGAVTVNSGAHIKGGAGAASGTLTVPTLNLQSGGLLAATLGAPTNSAKVAVVDNDGATIDGKLQIDTVNGFDDGTFRVLTYNGNRGGTGLQQSDQLGNGFDNITILDSGASGFIDVTVAITKRQWNVDSPGSWVTGGNWTGGTGGAPTGPGSVANFLSAINADRVVTIDDAPKTVGIVNFDNANKYTIAGTSLVIDTWGADGQINVVNGSHEISAPTTLAKNTNINVASGKSLLISGNVSGTGGIIHSGSGTTTLTGVNTYSGANTVSAGTLVGNSTSIIGTIANDGAVVFNQTTDGTFASVISGTGSVTKNGAGVLSLTAANPFTGGFNLNVGAVAVNSTTALGAANMPVNIAGGTTISTTTTTARTLTNAFAVNGNFSLGQATGGTAAVTMAGTINLGGATRTVTLVNAADTISGIISNGGLAVNAGTGVLSITGAANTYSGATTLSTGTTAINATSILGDGTGAINMAGGTLRITTNRTVAVANPIVMTANTLVETNSAATTVDLNFSNNSIAGSAGTLTFKNNGADASGDTFQPRFSGGGFTFSRPIVIDNGTTGKTNLNSYNTTGTTQTFSGVISGTGAYTRTASVANTGGVTVVTAENTYSGGTTVNEGTLLANNSILTGSATGTGTVTVGNGIAATTAHAVLGGTGSVGGVAGAVTVKEGGYIAPGGISPDPLVGTLTTLGNVTFLANSHLSIDLSGATADKLVIGGNLDLSLAEFLDVTGTGTGSSWLIGTYAGTLNGTFNTVTSGYAVDVSGGNITLNLTSLPGDFNNDTHVDAGDYASIRKQFSDITTGAGLTAYNAWRANFGVPPGAGSGGGLGNAAVPEPGTIGLVAIGLSALAFRRRDPR